MAEYAGGWDRHRHGTRSDEWRRRSKKFPHSSECQKAVLIGLVGDIAGGKTTVARRLATLGAGWIDADRLAHWCLRLPWVKSQIRNVFGDSVFTNGGLIDRRLLAGQVFGADEESVQRLQYLQRIVHPPTREFAVRRLQRFVKRGVMVIVLDAPLLLEAVWDVLCDEVWCVEAPRSQRIKWAAARGWSDDELAAREARQISTAEKRQRSTVVLKNYSDRSTLMHEVDRLFERRILGRRNPPAGDTHFSP